jgi:hypothetical protein
MVRKKVMKEIADKMKWLGRVSVQTWKEWSPNNLFRGWFSTLGPLIGAKHQRGGMWQEGREGEGR